MIDSTETYAKTALLAEDDSLIRELVGAYLERLGYAVVEAEDGRHALEILERSEASQLDLVVTDLLMPKVNGRQVVEAALKQGMCERFLIMSGNPLESEDPNLMDVEGVAYLEKPFTFTGFEAALGSLSHQPLDAFR